MSLTHHSTVYVPIDDYIRNTLVYIMIMESLDKEPLTLPILSTSSEDAILLYNKYVLRCKMFLCKYTDDGG
jgi:hypothetical protein